MSAIARKYPALSLLVLAMIFGTGPLLAVNVGLLPAGYDQLGAFSASLAGIVLAAVEGRRGGVRELLSRFLIWRVDLRWWAFVLLFPILPAVASLYLYYLSGGPAVDWSQLKPLSSVVPMILFLTVAAGMGEEFGWRGFALPRLQARHNALTASLIVGLIWSSWHIPLFLTKGTIQYEWRVQAGLLLAVLAYSLFVTFESILCTWVFNNTKGSVLVAAVMHGALNAWNGYIDVYRGHFGGILTYMLVMVTVSILITLWAGPTNLSRPKERNVLAPEDSLPVGTAATPVAI